MLSQAMGSSRWMGMWGPNVVPFNLTRGLELAQSEPLLQGSRLLDAWCAATLPLAAHAADSVLGAYFYNCILCLHTYTSRERLCTITAATILST
jgi:hypothetical protein